MKNAVTVYHGSKNGLDRPIRMVSGRKGFDMSAFVPAFMKSRTAALMDSSFNHLQWAGEAYVLEESAF